MSSGSKINSGTLIGTLVFNFKYILSKFANLV